MQDSTINKKDEKNSLLIMILTLLSRLLGIVKASFISSAFGSSNVADSINFAYNLPNNLRKLFAEGSLSQSYLPLLAKNRDEKCEALINQIITFQILIFIPILLFTFSFSKEIITFISNFDNPETILISSRLLPYFTIFLIFISFSTLYSSLLNSRNCFFSSSFAPIVFTLCVILCVKFLTSSLSYYSMALATILGSISQFLIVYISSRKFKLRLRLDFHFNNEIFIKMINAFIPATLSSLILIITQAIILYIASSLKEGSVSAFSYSIIFYQAPYGIFFTAIQSVYFPLLSREKSIDEKNKILIKALEYLSTFLLPSTICLYFLRHEVISLILQRGAFTLSDTLLCAKILSYFLLSLLPLSYSNIINRYFYSNGDYKYPLFVSLFTSTIQIVLSIILARVIYDPSALSLSFLISQSAALIIYLIKIKGFNYYIFIKKVIKLILLNLPLFILLSIYYLSNNRSYEKGRCMINLILTTSLIFGSVLLTLIVYILFKVPFLSSLRKKD